MIEFRKVYMQYVSEFFSLYNFSCEIKSHTLFLGDFYNGTTAIMRILSKIDKHYKGVIFLDNINLKNIKDKELNISYLPENPVLFKNKNVFNNLYYPLKIRKINKNSAKSLIYSIFSEIKDKNFNFLENYFTNHNNDNLIENIFKLKIKNLNSSEQKIIALIRAVLRSPRYVLLENFFENLEEQYLPIASFLINRIKQSSIIIACEKDEINIEIFNKFKILKLSSNDQ